MNNKRKMSISSVITDYVNKFEELHYEIIAKSLSKIKLKYNNSSLLYLCNSLF